MLPVQPQWETVLTVLLSLTACGRSEEFSMRREGIAPCKLSQREEKLLESFGIEDHGNIFSFKAPEEAISLNVHVYRLNGAGEWEVYSGGGVSIGEDRKPVETLSGTFALELSDNYSIDFHINCGGLVSFASDEIGLEKEIVSGMWHLELSEFRKIALNEEIPVVMMMYSSKHGMKNHALQERYDPAVLSDIDLAQLVTVEFTDKE